MTQPRLLVAFHTPVATELLDEKTLTGLSQEVLADAAEELNSGPGRTGFWRVPSETPFNLQGYDDVLADRLLTGMPHPILESDPHEASKAMSKLGDGSDYFLTGWSLEDAALTIWNTGAALLLTTYSVEVAGEPNWRELAAIAAKARRPAREAAEDWLDVVLNEFVELAKRNHWHDELVGDPSSTKPFWSGALWTYHSFHVVTPQTDLVRVAEDLVEDEDDRGRDRTEGGSVMRIGLSSCLVSKDHSEGEAWSRLLGLIGTHTVCWASAIVLDTFVSDRLLGLKIEDTSTSTQDGGTLELLNAADKIGFFLTMINGVRRHLVPEDGALWDRLDENWRFVEQREGLAGRLQLLRALHGERAAQLNKQRLDRLNLLVLALTSVGVIAAAADVVALAREADVWSWVAFVGIITGLALLVWLVLLLLGGRSDRPGRHKLGLWSK